MREKKRKDTLIIRTTIHGSSIATPCVRDPLMRAWGERFDDYEEGMRNGLAVIFADLPAHINQVARELGYHHLYNLGVFLEFFVSYHCMANGRDRYKENEAIMGDVYVQTHVIHPRLNLTFCIGGNPHKTGSSRDRLISFDFSGGDSEKAYDRGEWTILNARRKLRSGIVQLSEDNRRRLQHFAIANEKYGLSVNVKPRRNVKIYKT